MSKVLQRFYPNFSTRYFPLQISVNFVVFVQSFSHSWLFTTPWTVFPVFHYFLEFGQTHVPGGSDDKESACNVGDLGSIPGSGRFPGGGHGNPLQYSCLGNPTDRGACQPTVHRVAKSRTQPSDLPFTLMWTIFSLCWVCHSIVSVLCLFVLFGFLSKRHVGS